MIIFCARSAVRGGVILSEVDAGPLNGVCYVRWVSRACYRSQLASSPRRCAEHHETHPSSRLACPPREAPARAGALAVRVSRESCRDHRQFLRGLSKNRSQAPGLCQICPMRMRALMNSQGAPPGGIRARYELQKTRLIFLKLRNIPQQERHNDERWSPS
jgi:hypothetical protein